MATSLFLLLCARRHSSADASSLDNRGLRCRRKTAAVLRPDLVRDNEGEVLLALWL
jgi:hypothetical protein